MNALVRAFGLAVSLSLCGCAAGKQLTAGATEYRLYRETRIAPTVEERLAAGNRYLHSEPDGRYADDVRAWFAPAERAYVGSAWNSLPKLRAYLAALRDGPNVERVKARAAELEATIGFAEKRARAEKQRTESSEALLARAASQRKAFVAELSEWIGALAGIRAWNKPIAELEPALLQRFGPAVAEACVGNLCAKAFTPRFAIPQGDGRLVPREAAFTVELVLTNGLVSEARLQGRELFSRLSEALDRRAVSFSDPQSRAEAIGRALAVVTAALDAQFPSASCEKPAVSPVVLERACNGSRALATSALGTGENDSLVFGPELAPAPAAPATKTKPKPKP